MHFAYKLAHTGVWVVGVIVNASCVFEEEGVSWCGMHQRSGGLMADPRVDQLALVWDLVI